MKKSTDHTLKVSRISRGEHLPLLRGMFVVPRAVGRKQKVVQRNTFDSGTTEDELYLTADKGYYLGE